MKTMTDEEFKQLNFFQKCGLFVFGLGILGAILLGALLVIGALFAPTEKAPTPTEEAVAEPAPPPRPAERAKREPLDLQDARLLAQRTMQATERGFESLVDATRLQDRRGKYLYVDQPLKEQADRWPTLLDERDATAHFHGCREAALAVQSMSAAAIGEQTTGSLRHLRDMEQEYHRGIERCRAELALSDAAIMRRAAAEQAALERDFGGRDCLTSYDLDPKTDELVALPKPAHCPK